MYLVKVIWPNMLEITLLSMKWLALVDQLLHVQQPNLTGVLQRSLIVLLGHNILLKYRRLVVTYNNYVILGS